MRSISGTEPYALVSDTEPDVMRGGGGWRGLVWLTWRQHRWLIAITALAVLAEVAGMLMTSGVIRSYGSCPEDSACMLQLRNGSFCSARIEYRRGSPAASNPPGTAASTYA